MITQSKNALIEKWLKRAYYLLPIAVMTHKLMPFLLKGIINRVLRKTDGQYVQIGEINLSLFPAFVEAKNIYLDKIDKDTRRQTMLVSADLVRVSFNWRNLKKGVLECEILGEKPAFSYIKRKPAVIQHEEIAVKPNGSSIPDVNVPVLIKKCAIKGGRVEFINLDKGPMMDIEVRNIHFSATNLTTSKDNIVRLPANVELSATIYDGELSASLNANLLADKPTFTLKAGIQHMDMVLLNDLFDNYGKFDVSHGLLDLSTELDARDGEYSGFATHMIHDLHILGPEDKDDNLVRYIWEGVVDIVARFFEHEYQQMDEEFKKLPIKGTFIDSKAPHLIAVLETLKVAFSTLRPSLNYHILYHSRKKSAAA